MSGDKDSLLLSEFKKAFARNGCTPYSNLDENFTHKFDYFVKRYEDIMEVTGTHIPPHKWSYHRIGLITKGEAFYTCGIYRFTATKNTLLVIPARLLTTSDWSADGCGYTILFSLDFLIKNKLSYKFIENKAILQPSIQPFLNLDDDQSKEIESIFNTMLKEKGSREPFSDELMAMKIVELVILCERFYSEVHDMKKNNEVVELLRKFSDLTEEHFCQERSVSFYATQLHIHPNYLNSLVKTNTGITAKESIQNRILLEAKYLLHNTNLSVKEIANKIGFVDPNYFTTFFKRMEKISPGAYRNQYV